MTSHQCEGSCLKIRPYLLRASPAYVRSHPFLALERVPGRIGFGPIQGGDEVSLGWKSLLFGGG